MKVKTMALAAGVCTPLILSGSASGGFVEITTTSKPNDFGLLVVNVYAVFDRPGEDWMTKVAGTPMNPLLIQVENGTFYNHPFGSASVQPPNPGFIPAFPSLAFDSFVTIGKKDLAGSNLTVTPGFPDIIGSSLFTDSAGWAITPNNPQGNPFDPANVSGNGQILIAQFSTADGTAIHGTMLIGGISNGISFQSVVSFFQVPGPSALALLGLAGLLRVRRRRR